MSSRPTVTVIIPTLNRARFLERTLCSALDQGYANVETIVIDGGSSDESQDIICRYQADLSLTLNLQSGSTAHLINHALQAARGDVVGVLPAGDLYLPFALSRVTDRFTASDSPSWLIAGTVTVDDRDRLIETHASEAVNQWPSFLHHSGEPPALAATFWRRQMLVEAGEFDPQLLHLFDFEYTCRLLSRGQPPASLNETLSCTRSLSSVATKDRLVRQRERSQIVLKYTREIASAINADLPAQRTRRRITAA